MTHNSEQHCGFGSALTPEESHITPEGLFTPSLGTTALEWARTAWDLCCCWLFHLVNSRPEPTPLLYYPRWRSLVYVSWLKRAGCFFDVAFFKYL